MNYNAKVKLGGIFTTFLFIWLYGGLSILPIVDGQYETAKNGCGGIFRSISGKIDFIFNSTAGVYKPGADPEKVCLWTIIPNPMYTQFRVSIDWNLGCNGNTGNDVLSITTFRENTDGIEYTGYYCNQTTLTLTGQVMVVTLISNIPVENNGFTMSWTRVEGDTPLPPGNRFVTAFNSYGRTTNQPIPYFAGYFMGNSLSTYAFHKGNNTGSYILQMVFTEVKLAGNICRSGVPKGCDMLRICAIEKDGRITSLKTYKGENFTLAQPETFRNKFGFFFIMWGGNPNSAAGGGSMVLEYSTVRD